MLDLPILAGDQCSFSPSCPEGMGGLSLLNLQARLMFSSRDLQRTKEDGDRDMVVVVATCPSPQPAIFRLLGNQGQEEGRESRALTLALLNLGVGREVWDLESGISGCSLLNITKATVRSQPGCQTGKCKQKIALLLEL